MKKKMVSGIFLILAALGIGGIFLWQTYCPEPEKLPDGEARIKETGGREHVYRGSASQGAVSGVMASPAPADLTEPSAEGTGKGSWADIDPDILAFMEVSDEEFTEELRIYANGCGCGAAEKTGDLEEMIVDYGKKTVTIPCYFKVGKEVSKFDVVYQYEKKRFHFIPW